MEKCKKCGYELADGVKYCGMCGWSSDRKKPKLFLGIIALIAVVLISTVTIFIVVRENSRWEEEIIISGGTWVSNGYLNAGALGGNMLDHGVKGNPYYEYEITNDTNHPMSNVVMVFSCTGTTYTMRDEAWEHEVYVGYLRPHETKTVRAYHWEMFPNEFENDDYLTTSHEVKKVVYD